MGQCVLVRRPVPSSSSRGVSPPVPCPAVATLLRIRRLDPTIWLRFLGCPVFSRFVRFNRRPTRTLVRVKISMTTKRFSFLSFFSLLSRSHFPALAFCSRKTPKMEKKRKKRRKFETVSEPDGRRTTAGSRAFRRTSVVIIRRPSVIRFTSLVAVKTDRIKNNSGHRTPKRNKESWTVEEIPIKCNGTKMSKGHTQKKKKQYRAVHSSWPANLDSLDNCRTLFFSGFLP